MQLSSVPYLTYRGDMPLAHTNESYTCCTIDLPSKLEGTNKWVGMGLSTTSLTLIAALCFCNVAWLVTISIVRFFKLCIMIAPLALGSHL